MGEKNPKITLGFFFSFPILAERNVQLDLAVCSLPSAKLQPLSTWKCGILLEMWDSPGSVESTWKKCGILLEVWDSPGSVKCTWECGMHLEEVWDPPGNVQSCSSPARSITTPAQGDGTATASSVQGFCHDLLCPLTHFSKPKKKICFLCKSLSPGASCSSLFPQPDFKRTFYNFRRRVLLISVQWKMHRSTHIIISSI